MIGIKSWPPNTGLLARYTTSSWPRIYILPDATTGTFRGAVDRSLPSLLPRGTFQHLPAIHRWFAETDDGMGLRWPHWEPFDKALVPLEFTTPHGFDRASAPLSILMAFLKNADNSTKARFYLAQAPLPSLPAELVKDLPTPELLRDLNIYDTSLWLGMAPTSTPLHRDPNPNLLVQLAGEKRIRMLPPEVGDVLFASIKAMVGQNAAYARARGQEMMLGPQRDVLEEIWEAELVPRGVEAVLHTGDGIFIPQGWWHSVRGTGNGVTASVNWWFRSKQ